MTFLTELERLKGAATKGQRKFRLDSHGSRWGRHPVLRDWKKCPICQALAKLNGAEK
jgi:hypothetical protein